MDTYSSMARWDGGSRLTEADKNQIREGFRRLEKDSRFYDSHSAEWRKQYPDMYLAVYQEELVCVAAKAEELITCLRAKDIPIEECYCKFLTPHPVTLAPANRAVQLD